MTRTGDARRGNATCDWAKRRRSSSDGPVRGAIDLIEQYFEQGWTDGCLSCATEELVDSMIAASGREPLEVVGVVPPRQGVATIEAIGANAVMAAAAPSICRWSSLRWKHCWRAVRRQGLQRPATVATLVIVSGPVVQQVGMNHGIGLFRSRQPATPHRWALRLVLVNVAGASGFWRQSTLGSPANTPTARVDVRQPWTQVHTSSALPPRRACALYAADAPRGITRRVPEHGVCALDTRRFHGQPQSQYHSPVGMRWW